MAQPPCTTCSAVHCCLTPIFPAARTPVDATASRRCVRRKSAVASLSMLHNRAPGRHFASLLLGSAAAQNQCSTAALRMVAAHADLSHAVAQCCASNTTASQHMWYSCACLLEAGLWDWSVSLRRRPRDAVEGSPCCRLACCMCGCSATQWHVSHDAAGPAGCRPRRLLGRTEPQQHMKSCMQHAAPAAGLAGRAVGRLPSASSPENAGEGDAAMLLMDSAVTEHPSQPAGNTSFLITCI